MRPITQKEMNSLEFIRVEKYRNYFYGLATLPNGKYVTVSSYKGTLMTMQELPDINPDIPKNQTKLEFVNDHAIIHITPKKYVWRWINDDY